ncbi:hypothetical protein AS156_32185 [Bradyrhizobium macuxiense]|uniref:Uncharacterized protein n=1 Tax=Bradyrhizobium macuxiense TaxID=1755647 RepID=A0A109K1Y1_9BRAD|nr:hypothetical protein [Bradyrhizobium macuxiense]KWV59321.1 hypothetical protein AS156_32185 [Bradyrhizobium macuxiense]
MAARPNPEFGKRRPNAPPRPGPPVKRSNHVALLVMGTLAVGGGAYALMPRQNCQPPAPGMAAPAVPQPGADCPPRNSSSSGGHAGGGGSWSHSSFYSGGGSSSGSSSSSTSSSSSSSSSVSRGGFGSFAHALGFGGG